MLGLSGVLRALIRFDDVRAEERRRGATCAASGPRRWRGAGGASAPGRPRTAPPRRAPRRVFCSLPAGERAQHRGAGESRTESDRIGPTGLLCSSVIYIAFFSSNFNANILDVRLFWGKSLSQCTVKNINVEVLTGHFSFSVFLYTQIEH